MAFFMKQGYARLESLTATAATRQQEESAEGKVAQTGRGGEQHRANRAGQRRSNSSVQRTSEESYGIYNED